MSTFVIALNTFREAVRDKILYVLTLFAFMLIMVSRAVGWVSYGGELKITTDLGLLAIWLFGAFIAIFIGTGMIYKEIDKRTLYTILSKPIDRWQFVVGKYLGLLLTIYVSLTILSVIFFGYLALMGAPIGLPILQAVLLTYLEMMVVTAIAIFFSSASTPVLSAIFTSVLFGVGQLTKWIVDLGSILRTSAPWVEEFLHGLYLVMPNLHNFNVRQEAVVAAGNAGALALPWSELGYVAQYGISYSVVLLLLAILLFRRRNF
ncbi:MAG: ABC transporter permease [Planctomycetota bacterium]|nr:ABC transporter permease [Planctomycetota bacterium]